MDRREFLVGTGVALGAEVLAGCDRRPTPVSSESAAAGSAATSVPPSGDASWSAIKAEFVGLAAGLAHLSCFFLASHPRTVRDAIERHRRALDENPLEYVEKNVVQLETAVRAAAAEYVGSSPDDLALTDSTTMGLGVVYGGLRLAPGTEILSTTHDHMVTTVACQQRAARGDVTFRQVPLYDDPANAEAGAIVDRFASAIRPRTRVAAITWVHSGTGVKLPVRALADRLAAINANRPEADRVLLCVDGVHGFGIEDVRLPDLGCDYFMAGCHKWIFGPRGTGLVWARPGAWSATSPTIPSMDPLWRREPREKMPPAALLTPGGFHSFEHRWALDAAFRFHLGVGKAKVATRIHALNRHVKDELSKMPKVHVVTPRADDLSAGIVCFAVDGYEPRAVVERLRAANVVASVTPSFYQPAYARLAAGLITLEADVDAALAAVRAL
jgi:selenocysteine lyase/cysteine desulfurase